MPKHRQIWRGKAVAFIFAFDMPSGNDKCKTANRLPTKERKQRENSQIVPKTELIGGISYLHWNAKPMMISEKMARLRESEREEEKSRRNSRYDTEETSSYT